MTFGASGFTQTLRAKRLSIDEQKYPLNGRCYSHPVNKNGYLFFFHFPPISENKKSLKIRSDARG